MGDSPPPGYSGGSVLQTPATEIPMMRVQGGGGSSDVFGQVPQIPIQRMVGGNGEKDDVVTEAVIAHIIATVMLDEENKEHPAPAPAPATPPAPPPAPARAPPTEVKAEQEKPPAIAPITPYLPLNVERVPEYVPENLPPIPLEYKKPTPEAPTTENKEPTPTGTGKQTKLLWNYSGKNRIRVRTNLTDNEIKAFLTLKPEAFQLDERALFDSLFFSEDDVRKYLVDHSEDFVRFWRRFIDYDGTHQVFLYTTKEGRKIQDFLKNIANVRLKNLLGNVAYLLPAHKRSAYVDPGNLVLGKQEQKTVKPPIEFLPTEVEKTKFTQGQFDIFIKPIEERLAELENSTVIDEVTIDKFNNAREFVKLYEELQKNDMLKLKGQKSELEWFQKENEPKIQVIMTIKQRLSTASTQDTSYIAELTTQKEALDQINTGYTLYISKIDELVSRCEDIIKSKNTLYDTLKDQMEKIKRKLEKKFKAPAPAPLTPGLAAAEAARAKAVTALPTPVSTKSRVKWVNQEDGYPLSSNKPLPGIYSIPRVPKRVTLRKPRKSNTNASSAQSPDQTGGTAH